MKYAQATRTHTYEGHKDAVYALALGPSGTFFTAGGEGLVVHWDVETAQAIRPLLRTEGALYALSYHPTLDLLAVGRADGGVHIVHVASQEVRMSKQAHAAGKGVFAFAWVDGALLSGGGDGQLIRWNLDSYSSEAAVQLTGQSLRSLALCPTGDHLAAGGSDGHIRILSPELAVAYDFLAHQPTAFTVAYSNDGRYLYSGGRDALLKTWDRVERYGLRNEVPAHLGTLQHLALSTDGRYLATAAMDKTIKLWQPSELKLLKVIDATRCQGHTNAVNRLAWLPQAPNEPAYRLLSVGDDRQVLGWKLRFWEETH